ncbi:MAG: pentapeptide repeat-containing protein [Pseudomonadota bacterium]
MPRPHKLTRRTLPARPEAPDPKAQLAHIAELSRNARTTWFGLLGLLAFVGITLLGHADAAFFAKGAATRLPLVGITVPVEAFFATAPVLVAAVYAYLHLYLMTLWDALAEAEPRVDGKPLTERVYPWLLSYAALWYRNLRRQDSSAAPRALGLVVVAVSVFLGWVLGIIVMAGLWIRSMPAHDELLTLWIGVCLWFAVQVGWTGFMTARARMAGAWRETVAAAHWSRRVFGLAFAALLGVLSWETTEGGLIPHESWHLQPVFIAHVNDGSGADLPPLLVPANLREAELTPRPKDWKPFELWLRDLRRSRRINDPEQDPLIPTREEMDRWALVIEALDAPDLQGRDLRGAQAAFAFWPGVDLRRARADGADLRYAHMEGARLGTALLRGAHLINAHLPGATLWSTELSGANLSGAHLQGANLEFARLRGAGMGGVRLHGAFLSQAIAKGAHLGAAQMQGADLMGMDLVGANLQDATLSMASCKLTRLDGALVPDTDLSCTGLEAYQVQMAVGTAKTRLPGILKVRSCLPPDSTWVQKARAEIDAAIDYHPARNPHFRPTRASIRKAVFCFDGEAPQWVGRRPDRNPDFRSGR